ncbi:MAG TPA: RDD family protein [Thermoanaerobaculia bacterium]|nr:RDD family protein [Thermoanaerobaculia bacterium]
MKRFDEIDLLVDPQALSAGMPVIETPPPIVRTMVSTASRFKRSLTYLTDVSLFVALAIAMTTLLDGRGDLETTLERNLPQIAALTGFLLLLSFFYYVGSWLIWGKTIGGAIFDIRVLASNGAPIDIRRAARRWLATLLTTLTAGIGFLPALFPSRLSLPDLVSDSRCAGE